MRTGGFLLGLSALAVAAPVQGGGFLWISGEFAPPTSIYRYNIAAGTIDLVVQPQSPGGGPLDPATDVYNNLATDGSTLYIGVDDDQVFAKANPFTALVTSVGAYTPPTSGLSLEDGSFNAGTGTLWRTGIFNELYETDTSGNVLAARTVSGSPFTCGLEWVGPTLYATTLDGGTFGSVMITGPTTATFTAIPLVGIPSDHLTGGLAYDATDSILYMATTDLSEAFLWEVDPILGTATLVRNLTADAGYPKGFVLPDAMGWVAPAPASMSLLALGGLIARRRRRS